MQEQNNTPLQQEALAEKLLDEMHNNQEVNFYDLAASLYPGNSDALMNMHAAAVHLSKEKLAHYTDEQHTCIAISNYGRYWMLKGGYVAFLMHGHGSEIKEHELKEQHQTKYHSKEELLEARLKLTRFRLVGFWLTLIIAIAGFVFSLVNFFLLTTGKK